MFWFIIGLLLGASAGIMIMCMIYVNKDDYWKD